MLLITGGVKSWSVVAALQEAGLELVGTSVKKSTKEDKERIKELMGDDAHMIDDMTPREMYKMLKDAKADIMLSGGKSQFVALKATMPWLDINQERSHAYTGYDGMVKLVEEIDKALFNPVWEQIRKPAPWENAAKNWQAKAIAQMDAEAAQLAADPVAAEAARRARKICNCKTVDLGTIEDAIKAHGLTTVEQSFPQTREFIHRISELLIYLIPHYIREGKSYLTIAFGCTGGKHRSVMIAEDVKKRLAKAGLQREGGASRLASGELSGLDHHGETIFTLHSPFLRGEASYTPADGRSHIFPSQQPLLPFDMSHLPSLQQPPSLPQHDILPSLSLAIIGHFIPDLPSL